MLCLVGLAIVLIGVPFYKLVKEIVPKKRDPVAEAKQRLVQAQLEIEAAKLNKEAEQIYEKLYSDTLENKDQSKRFDYSRLNEEEIRIYEEEISKKGKS